MIAQTRDGDVEFVARAAERGISAWIESTAPESVQGAIEVALRRYEETERLEEKVGQLESALERRAVIERAKGILMERHGDRRARRVRPDARPRPQPEPPRRRRGAVA